MILGNVKFGVDRFSDRKAGHLDLPATQILSRDTTRGIIMNRTRENNTNWRGGRHTSSHGYVKVLVDINHHLADGKGYAYEHRVVAEKKLGRKLRPNEKVHHIDGNRKNNLPENIKVVNGNAEHYFEHRDKNNKLRKPNESNPQIKCFCGCEGVFYKYDNTGRPRKYISGHNMRKRDLNAKN